jgi:hypothetical protein
MGRDAKSTSGAGTLAKAWRYSGSACASGEINNEERLFKLSAMNLQGHDASTSPHPTA